MASTDPLVAVNRFGLGPRPGDLARIAADPRGAVAAELDVAGAALLEAPDLPASDVAIRALRAAERARDAERVRRAAATATAEAGRGVPAMSLNPLPAMVAQPARPPDQQILRAELAARFARLAATAQPFVERLVLFWSNHFAVSQAKGGLVRATVGALEREAIRPHVLGRFADMLRAVESHPAMLAYLDNTQSIGPNSRAGRNRKRGLNENLAREILELHTLGADGGYGQADVTALAGILTGWTVVNADEDDFHGGRFTFAPARHEPGAHTLLGRTYPEAGHEQGLAALADLARHPATARHVARKLARHFVDDQPPPALVERLERTFLSTDGDLGAVARALLAAPEAWRAEATRIRPPLDFVVAMMRALGRAPDFGPTATALAALGQPAWSPPGPDGWPDDTAAWQSPAGLANRLDIAVQFARLAGDRDPAALAADLFGDAVSAATLSAVARAESRQQAVALLFMAPEFQRR